MQTRRTLTPIQKRTRKFLDRYGDQLFCVRYRYDKLRHRVTRQQNNPIDHGASIQGLQQIGRSLRTAHPVEKKNY